ncbi:TetR family transcriptional regulator [Streptomyces sp. YC504]|uniref:TetR family transcriptional regulator n=1 Tax=Streptomyces mesophilus TaxID=1775132 RepID=A0A6G4XK48_9ACTN|nr:TetR/AcrR family transcriptional regulator [Streptomyces mesophilus]NGO77939.1 TetR family transcriptional regulator [Streptomyces mesophilus]
MSTPPRSRKHAPPRSRKHAPPREDVLAAAMAMVADGGLDQLTMAALGREVAMSSGHLLYYFKTKDELLLQTLEWSEGRLGEQRRALLSGASSVRERLDAYVDLYVPEGPRDPHWTLWMEVWNRSPYADASVEAGRRQLAIERAWHRDLVALLAEGISRGEFRGTDPERFATRLRALLDGFSVHVAVGLPGANRDEVLVQVREFLDESLRPD